MTVTYSNLKRLLLCLAILALLVSCQKRTNKVPPKVIKGELDLSKWNFEKDGSTRLSGEWEFYWNKLYSSKELKTDKPMTGYLNIPLRWNGVTLNKTQLTGIGYATYRAKVKIGKIGEKIAFRFKENPTAVSIFANGEKIFQKGVVGKSKETHLAGPGNGYVEYTPKSKNLEFIIHLSNFTHRDGGTWSAITVGSQKEVLEKVENDTAVAGFIVGACLIMSLYHLALYLIRRKEYSNLVFSLFSFWAAARNAATLNGDFLLKIFPDLSYDWFKKPEYLGFFIGQALMLHYLRAIFPNDTSKWLVRIFWGFAAVASLITLFTSVLFYTDIIEYYQVTTLLMLIVAVTQIILAVKNRRDGSIILLFGILTFGFAIAWDITVHSQQLHVITLGEVFFVIFILFQSVLLSKRFAQAFFQVEVKTRDNIHLQAIDREKTHFFQNVSHELRTPLTLIMNPLEEACEKYKDDFLKVALNNSKRLYRLLNQLLDFQKISSGNKDLHLTQINLNEFLTPVSTYFRSMVTKKNISFQLNIDTEMDVYILGEIDALEKIIFNYLSNAIKYTPDGGKIHLILGEKNDRTVRISVSDSGSGISKENQKKLFKVFSQVDSEDHPVIEGTGLGLALVKELTEKLNGNVGVESGELIGSTFYVEFPIYRKEKQSIDILVVDDEEKILQEVSDIFIPEGIDVFATKSTAEAREALKTHNFKCVLSDMNMPREGGVEFLTYMKHQHPKTNRVLMTGQGDVENLSEAMNKAKLKNIILKPIERPKLLEIIKPLLKEQEEASNEKLIDLLYVDDDLSALDRFDQLILAAKPSIKHAMLDSPKSAKEFLLENKAKCILSDFNMPGEDGITFLKYVKQVSPDTKRILATSENTDNIPKEAITQARIDEIFEKPITMVKIERILQLVEESEVVIKNKKINLAEYQPKDWHIIETGDIEKVGDDIDEVIDGDGELILIVDDLKDMRDLIQNTLSKKNYKIVKAIDGEDALIKAKKHNPDLIISDWIMPRKSGIEMIEDLKKDSDLSAIPVILLTAKSENDSRLIGTQSGASAYLGKPFNDLELLSTVDNLLNLKKGEDRIKKLNRDLSENVLKRFLPPTLVDNIVQGKSVIDNSYSKQNITVMFTDLCSFSSISADIGPQNMADMLNTYLDEMTRIIFDYGGTIDKIMGDAIMAFWGAPEKIDYTEQVKQAYLCSLDLNKKLLELNEIWKAKNLPEFTKRIGIHHGPAVVGYFGGKRRSDYTAIGNTVNRAQRIQSAANPGEIFVSVTVRDTLPETSHWEPAGSYKLKGILGEESLFKVIS